MDDAIDQMLEGAAPKAPVNDRIVHLHVPKTAGTALRVAIMEGAKQKLRMFPHYDETRISHANLEEFDFFSGHFGFATAQKLGGKWVTVLRNPFDRFISVYFFWRQLHERGVEVSRNTELAARYSLEEFTNLRDEIGLAEEFSNRVTWQLAYGSTLTQRHNFRLTCDTEDEILKIAQKNLGRFHVIGVQERMPEMVKMMRAELNLDIPLRKINVTAKRPEMFDVPMRVMNKIYEWIYMDVQLYYYVLRKVDLTSAAIG
jgi:hypothetical protein